MNQPSGERCYDFAIIGAGISGSFIARDLVAAGADVVLLEAGRSYAREEYPRVEVDGTSQLYWAGGLELTRDARLALLRPKVVGGGSVVNQALVDRFDDEAWDSWGSVSGVDFFSTAAMEQWYEAAEAEITIQYIPEERRNRNALIFQEGMESLGLGFAPLRRAQADCRHDEGHDCIDCLNGCRIGSKQSMPETTLKRALAGGLELVDHFEAERITPGDPARISGRTADGRTREYRAANLVLAGGAIGNSRLLLASGLGGALPALGGGFNCHPQYNNFAVMPEPVNAHKGAFQAFKSEEPSFRVAGYKLENVYAPPGAIAMLISGHGRRHMELMSRLDHFACIEVCTRDAAPGRISLDRKGRLVIDKPLPAEDRARAARGVAVVNDIFRAAGAEEIINCPIPFGLHLMGGLAMGRDPAGSVVGPDFRVHGQTNIWAADSSVFPNAPGINPSLTIMALSKKAASVMIASGGEA